MFGVTTDSLTDELREENRRLKRGCQSVGLSAIMFRTVKFLFYIVTLGTTVYLIQYAGVAPTLAMGFAILLISGPEALETWLIHRGAIEGGSDDGN